MRIFFLSQSSPILELFPFDKITLKSYICTVVTVMTKQCWSQTVLESGSWGHSVLQTPALVTLSIGIYKLERGVPYLLLVLEYISCREKYPIYSEYWNIQAGERSTLFTLIIGIYKPEREVPYLL